MHVHIYTYIHRERERERAREIIAGRGFWGLATFWEQAALSNPSDIMICASSSCACKRV